MGRARFDPRASLEPWRNLAAASGGQPLEFLSTDPSHERRLEALGEGLDAALAIYRETGRQGRRPYCEP